MADTSESDMLRSSISTLSSSRTILEKTPFWPIVWKDGERLKVRFNPGYLIDYNNRTGSKIHREVQLTHRPSNMDTAFEVESGSRFYLKIRTTGNDAAVSSIEIVQVSSEADAEEPNPKWHFGSVNVSPQGYQGEEDAFHIPMTEIDAASGLIKQVCLRENIHYQMFHMENVGGGPGRVLKSIGSDADVFGQNPSAQFRTIKGIDPIFVIEEDDTICIGSVEDSSDGGGSMPHTSSSVPVPKSAVVAYRDKYISFWCAEAPEPYFFELYEVLCPRNKKFHFGLEDEIVECCDKDSIKIWSITPDDPRINVKCNVLNGRVEFNTLNWFRRPNKINVLVGGTRKDFSKYRYKEEEEKIYLANNRFYNLAKSNRLKGEEDEHCVESVDV